MNKLSKKPAASGFTLIEILIVIGIIAILAAIVLVAVNPAEQFKKANDAQRSSNVNAILNAIGQYTVDEKGDLPGTIPSGVGNAVDITAAGTLCEDLVPDYIAGIPADPDEDPQTILEADCDTEDSGYEVYQDAGRVTIVAPNTEGDGDDISVTR